MITSFDLRNAITRLVRDGRYSLVILVSITLGLGVFLFLFSQVYAKKYSYLPFNDGERFVYISRFEQNVARLDGGLTNYEVLNILKTQNVLDDPALFERKRFTLSSASFTEQVIGVATSSNLFKLTAVNPVIGRTLNTSDDYKDAPPVLVLGYDIWGRLFQKQNDVIGKVIKVNGIPTTIVGVMPKGFKFPRNFDAWLSYAPDESPDTNGSGWHAMVGKLKADLNLIQVEDFFEELSRSIVKDYPQQYTGKSIAVRPYTLAFTSPISLLINIMVVVAFCVLFMSLFSVVSLIIVKMTESAKEAAIKNALGLPFSRIITGPLLESFFLCALSGVIGVFVCYLAQIAASNHVSSSGDPFWWEMKIGLPVIISAILFSLVAWVLTGLAPVYLAVRKLNMSQLAGGRKGRSAGTSTNFMGYFVSLQVACVYLLMVFTGICLYSLYKISTANYGVETSNVITGWIEPPASDYPDLQTRLNYFEKLSQQINEISDVDDVAFASAIPGTYSYSSTFNSLEANTSRTENFPATNEIPVSENFFDFFKVPLIRGREFISADDNSSEQVVIISEKIEQKISPGESAVGKKFQINPDKNGALVTVVGVVPDLLYGPPVSIYDVHIGAIYRPMKQVLPSWYGMRLCVKIKAELQSIEKKILEAGRNVDSQVALAQVRTYDDFLRQNGNSFRTLSFNFVPATILAFLMSVLGIYAISARTIQYQINDIGVMKALGINDKQINKIFISQSIRKLLLGIIVGILLFVVFISDVLSKFVVADHEIIYLFSAVIITVLASVVLLASYIPLHNAHRLTPYKALNK